MFALMLGAGISFAISFFLEFLDNRIKKPEDIKTKLGMTIMAVVPKFNEADTILNALNNPLHEIAEAYASLRTNLQFSAKNGGPRVIQITSTKPGEGKSVSSLGLALRFAGLGEKTLLIDADMRRPTFAHNSKIDSAGLSSLIHSNIDFAEYVVESRYDSLDIINGGAHTNNPSEILASQRFDDLIDFARERYDYIIIDSPPVLGLADAPILGAKVDASLMVIVANEVHTNNIKSAIERLNISGTNLVGAVITKYKAKRSDYSYYGGGYGYEEYKEHPSKGSVKNKEKIILS